MEKYDTIFLDRDGTLNPDPGYINSLDQFNFFDFTISALKEMSEYCLGFCIMTNQSGLSKGIIGTDLFGVSVIMTMSTTIIASIILPRLFKNNQDGIKK